MADKLTKGEVSVGKYSFSRLNLLLFALVFAAIGGFIIWKTYAAGGIDIRTRFEGNLNSDFGGSWDSVQPCIPTSTPSTGYPTSPTAREGTRSFMLHTEPGCKANGGTSSGARASLEDYEWPKSPYFDAENGYEFWYGFSFYVPAGQTNSGYIIQEWHAGQASVNYQAPWKMRIGGCNGSACTLFLTLNAGKINYYGSNTWETWGSYHNLKTIRMGAWNDVVFFVRWRSSTTGRILMYHKEASQSSFSQILDSNSTPFLHAQCNCNKVYSSGIGTRAWWPGGETNAEEKHYPVLMTYTGDTSPAATTYFDRYVRASNNPTSPDPNPGPSSAGYAQVAAEFGATGSTPPPPPPTPAPTVSLSANPTTISSGASSTLSWSSANATSCSASGAWSGTKATSGTQSVTPTSTSTYSLTCTGSGGSASASATVTVSSSSSSIALVSSSIQAGQTLSGIVPWSVSTSGSVSKVEFWANNTKLGEDTSPPSPFSYSLDTTKLPNGTNALGLGINGTDGTRITPQIGQVTVSNTATSPSCTSGKWLAKYFSNMTLSGSPATTTCEASINYNWGTTGPIGLPTDQFSASWEGTFAFDAANYDFSATTDDGLRLYIDNVLVLDKWIDQSATTYPLSRAMTAGNHTVKMEYYENAVDAVAKLSWVKQGDTTPPSVSLTSPTAGSTVSGTVNVAASASDNVGVSKVEFYIDGSLKSTDTASPYSYSWDSTSVLNDSHTIIAKAYDGANNSSSSQVSVTVSNGDTTPPSTPSGLSASASAYNKVNLSWSASTDNVGIAGYYIVRNGTTIASTSGTGTTYADSTVNASTTYSYYVIARDAAGNNSSASNTASVTTPSAPDTTPPSQPSNLSATAVSSSQINLSWNASTDNVGVTGYDIYRNNTRIATVTTTSFGNTGLSASTTYSYYVIARDAAGNSSAPSSTISATTQSLPSITTGNLNGLITSSSGGNIPGRPEVSLLVNGATRTYRATSQGAYFIPDLPAATYSTNYSGKFHAPTTRSTTITSGTTTTINVTLQRQ